MGLRTGIVSALVVGVLTSVPAALGAESFRDLCAGERETCELAAGTYSPSRTTPTMTFVLDEGWSGHRHYADAFSIGKGEVIVSMGRDITSGLAGRIGPGPSGFRDYLASHESLRVDESRQTTVAGFSGLQVDVVAVDDAGGLFTVEKDAYNLGAGQKARFFLLDVNGTTVVLIYESGTEKTFPAAVETAQPVIDSLEVALPDTSMEAPMPAEPAAIAVLLGVLLVCAGGLMALWRRGAASSEP